jgi:repressor LexA
MVRKNSYALRVRGHSMTDDQIQDGDIIIVEKRQTAENGETVVALIKGEQVTLKRFYVEPDGIRLQPANPEMDADLPFGMTRSRSSGSSRGWCG